MEAPVMPAQRLCGARHWQGSACRLALQPRNANTEVTQSPTSFVNIALNRTYLTGCFPGSYEQSTYGPTLAATTRCMPVCYVTSHNDYGQNTFTSVQT